MKNSRFIIFDKIHVEDARNHAHHRQRDTARTATNDTSLESAQKVKKLYWRTSAIGAVVTPRDAREDENSRFLLLFSKSRVYYVAYFSFVSHVTAGDDLVRFIPDVVLDDDLRRARETESHSERRRCRCFLALIL